MASINLYLYQGKFMGSEQQSFCDEINVFSELSEPFGAFDRAMSVMEILASSGNGLGEVLRDYAQQTYTQMNEFFHAVNQLVKGTATADDLEILKSAHFVLSSAATVLDMTPAAMLRNHADAVGGREKISREEIARISRAFRQAPEVMALMQSQEATQHLLIGAVNAGTDSRKLPLLSTALMPRSEARN